MRPAHKAVTATAVAVVATGLGAAPAAAQGIDVTPNTPHAGQRIHISVPDCSVGPTPHIAKSEAFTRDVTLYGKADTGDGDPRLKKDLRPGTYAITASCGNGRTVRGQIVVAKAGRSEMPGKQSHKPVTSQSTAGGKSPSPEASTGTLSASPAASQSKKSSNMPFFAIAGIMAVLIFGGAGLLFARRRGN